MSAIENDRPRHLIAEWDEGLAAVPFQENGRWKVRYTIVPGREREHGADQASTDETNVHAEATEEIPESVRAVLNLRGASSISMTTRWTRHYTASVMRADRPPDACRRA